MHGHLIRDIFLIRYTICVYRNITFILIKLLTKIIESYLNIAFTGRISILYENSINFIIIGNDTNQYISPIEFTLQTIEFRIISIPLVFQFLNHLGFAPVDRDTEKFRYTFRLRKHNCRQQ